MQVANLNAELRKHRETQPEGEATKVDHDHLMKSATPDLKSLGLKPIGKVGDPPAFLRMDSPYAGLSTNPETYRTAKPEVQRTAAEAPSEDAAKAQKANVDLLSNSKASSEDKIRAVDALYQSGMRDVTLADGRHYSLQEAGLGSGHMVHLFADGPDGKQHIVLRGIMEQDGKIDHEVGHTGKAVNFEGDWWSRHMSGQTPFAAGDPANFEYGNGRPICFNDSSQPNPWARPRPLAFKPEGDDPDAPKDPNGRPRPLAFKPGPGGDPNNINFDPNNSSPDGDASPLLRQQMAERAYHYMEVNPSLKGAGGYGNCSRIPRQMFADMGINLSGPDGNGMSGVRQGQTLERMGLFREISKEEAGPGDYLYRHWASRPGDLGDSAVVTGRDRNGNVYAVNGAVRHPFVVSTNHGYYTPEKYLRLTKAGEEYLRTHQNG